MIQVLTTSPAGAVVRFRCDGTRCNATSKPRAVRTLTGVVRGPEGWTMEGTRHLCPSCARAQAEQAGGRTREAL